MRIVMFIHSLFSDWNHGNAHFLRGIASELSTRGHDVKVLEPQNAWSFENLVRDYGDSPLREFSEVYPFLNSERYDLQTLDLNHTLEGADLVLVHEWNFPELIKRIGEHHAQSKNYKLLFHDTHHRIVSQPEEMSQYDLRHYDGVLAFGQVIADLYRSRGLVEKAWTWHEAADTRIFRSHRVSEPPSLDLVWVGNWGDHERTWEIQEFLIAPVMELGLKAEIYGVRYPESARLKLENAGIQYQGWISNFKVPQIFARAQLTVHIPRRPYVKSLPGIPTIRVFEALACGIPLVSAPWDDVEHLFTPGEDFLIAKDGYEMQQQISRILKDPELATTLAERGQKTIFEKHTCSHRVDELLKIFNTLNSV